MDGPICPTESPTYWVLRTQRTFYVIMTPANSFFSAKGPNVFHFMLNRLSGMDEMIKSYWINIVTALWQWHSVEYRHTHNTIAENRTTWKDISFHFNANLAYVCIRLAPIAHIAFVFRAYLTACSRRRCRSGCVNYLINSLAARCRIANTTSHTQPNAIQHTSTKRLHFSQIDEKKYQIVRGERNDYTLCYKNKIREEHHTDAFIHITQYVKNCFDSLHFERRISCGGQIIICYYFFSKFPLTFVRLKKVFQETFEKWTIHCEQLTRRKIFFRNYFDIAFVSRQKKLFHSWFRVSRHLRFILAIEKSHWICVRLYSCIRCGTHMKNVCDVSVRKFKLDFYLLLLYLFLSDKKTPRARGWCKIQ